MQLYTDDVLVASDSGSIGTGGGLLIGFDEILARVIDLLRREKRLSYRALKIHLELDNDAQHAVRTGWGLGVLFCCAERCSRFW